MLLREQTDADLDAWCMSRVIPDVAERAHADVDLYAYKNKFGEYGNDLALKTISSHTPMYQLLKFCFFTAT